MMKRLLALAAITLSTFALAPKAEASPCRSGHSYVTSRTSCGCPVYAQRYVAYYDRFGRPVVRTKRLPVTHRCRPVTPRCRPTGSRLHPGFRAAYFPHTSRHPGYRRSHGLTYAKHPSRCR